MKFPLRMAFFLKGYVSFSEYSTSSTAAPAPMPLAPQHQKTKRLLGAARGSTRHSRFGPHNRQQTAFKFSRRNGILATLGHLFKGNMWETTLFFFFSSFACFLYLSKRAFQLDNFSIETSLLQLPENQTTHTEIFSGKTRNSHVQHTRPRYHQHHPPSHPVVMKLKWGRPRGWRDGVVLVLIGRQGIKIRNGDELEGAWSSLRPQKTLKTPKNHEKNMRW